ncbi:autoinducer synthase [Tateyamaria sp.]|nr:autoinducer synthase [Tateyamaria sp.]
MLRYIYATDLNDHPKLARTMFRDRADQFKFRLGWNVSVDDAGFERDEYDELNPLYVIWEEPDGSHGGSMRFLPTTGRTMVNEHFINILSGPITSPFIWECTRFCLNRGAGRHVAAALMLGGGEVMQNFSVEHFVGVFDARMIRIYRIIGASPEVLGSAGQGSDQISVGLWHFDDDIAAQLADRAGVSPLLSRKWFDCSFGSTPLRTSVRTG